MKEVKQPRKPLIYYYLIALAVLLTFNFLFMPWMVSEQTKEVDYGTFMRMTKNKNIGEVQIESGEIIFTDKEGTNIYTTGRMDDPELVQRLYDSGAKFKADIVKETSPLLSILLTWIIPIAIFILLGQYVSKKIMDRAGGGTGAMTFGIGKANAKIYVKSDDDDGIRFSDVAGQDEAKENLAEIVEYLHDPAKYKEMGASKVRELFRQAKEKAPCIVFIDEIDAVGSKRGGKLGGNDEREQTLNQLLSEMDGFEGNTGVIILAATNRPEELDPALTRPGRFDRRVPVELPDLQGREAILEGHARKVKTNKDVDLRKIARMTSGASGAELANIINEAALRAVRSGRGAATQEDLEESVEVVIAGYQKKNAILSEKEKWTVAYHEIGHALVAARQTGSAPIQKITIIPRTSGALGYTMQVDEEDKYLLTKEELENRICTYTGGRAAEEIVYGTISTGAANDIEQATKIARAMITRYGMSEDFGMVAMETVTNQYLGGDTSLACSAETQSSIDAQVVELVNRQHQKARDILSQNREKMDELAAYLYEKESITGEEFMSILEK
ncbi:MAG: ATP-dependent metallopeptidase FtsH/Yme1/Tma family protein [Lentihominibacter sp.]|jgi:cell division protease FtsH